MISASHSLVRSPAPHDKRVVEHEALRRGRRSADRRSERIASGKKKKSDRRKYVKRRSSGLCNSRQCKTSHL
jgi:hypothetical protein